MTANPRRSTSEKVFMLLGSVLRRSGLAQAYEQTLRRSSCAVLIYHRVCPEERPPGSDAHHAVDPDEFDRQMRHIRARCSPISLDQLAAGLMGKQSFPPRAVHVTFDDGYVDLYDFAGPILGKYEVPATVFLAVDYVDSGRRFWWDDLALSLRSARKREVSIAFEGDELRLDLNTELQRDKTFLWLKERLWKVAVGPPGDWVEQFKLAADVPTSSEHNQILSWPQIAAMAANGVEFGSHTCSHARLVNLGDRDLNDEITGSKERLEAALGREVRAIAYPYGRELDYDSRAPTAARAAGYSLGFSAVQGLARPGNDPFQIRRVPVSGADSMDLFICKVSGAFPSLYAGCRWLLQRQRAN